MKSIVLFMSIMICVSVYGSDNGRPSSLSRSGSFPRVTYSRPNGFRGSDYYSNGRISVRSIGGPSGRQTFIYRSRRW